MTSQQAQQLIALVGTQNNYIMWMMCILACIVGIKVLTWLLRW